MNDPGSMNITLLTYLLGIAVFHGLYLSLLLYFKNGKDLSNRLLALTIFGISLYLINYLFFLTEIIIDYPNLLSVFSPAIYLVGPGYYFFVRTSLQLNFKWKPIYLLHLIPFVYNCWKSGQVYLVSADRKSAYIEKLINPVGFEFTWWEFFIGTYVSLLLLAYLIAAFQYCKKELRVITDPQNFKSISWLKNYSVGFIIVILLDTLIKLFGFTFELPAFEIEYLLAALIAIALHIAAYYAIGFLPKVQPLKGKYQTSSLNEAQIFLYQEQLLKVLSSEKPWLNADLKIADLALLINIPKHQLSQVLNEGLKTNFSDLMNAYRVEEVKLRLADQDFSHYSILAIALDCGFNNKATFNRVFKKITGMTPSGYLNEVS